MGARPTSFEATGHEEAESKPERQWSGEQGDIFGHFEDGDAGHLVVEAVAGSGKTTTLIEGVQRAPERRPLVTAFNKRIAEELNARLSNSYAQAKTLHGLGYSLVRREWKGMPVDEDKRQSQLTEVAVGKTCPKPIAKLVTNLHTKAREMHPLDWDRQALIALALRFDYVPDEGWGKYNLEFVVDAAIVALTHAENHAPDRKVGIDYADMLFLPLVWDLASKDYDLVVVDERQDMTMAQLELAQRSSGGRIVLVGDRHQSIYGFRGADSRASDRLKAALKARELPLPITYRCGTEIVKRAQRYVPHMVAAENAPAGIVEAVSYEDMVEDSQPGDYILSRLNAPLIKVVFRLLRQGTRARMAGRDIGQGIQGLIRRLKPSSPNDLIRKVEEWESKTTTRMAVYGQHQQIERVQDQADMLITFAAESHSLSDLDAKLGYLFTDVKTEDQVTCSSVHKAKGLEADRVSLLCDSFYRRGTNPEEDNIAYVAITRAKRELRYIEPHDLLQP